MIRKFIVTWEVEVQAEDVISAAEEARDLFFKEESPSFVVLDEFSGDDYLVEPKEEEQQQIASDKFKIN